MQDAVTRATRDGVSSPIGREHALKVTLTDEELARLDEMRPPGTSRPAFLRSLLRGPPLEDDAATRNEALSILTRLAHRSVAARAPTPHDVLNA